MTNEVFLLLSISVVISGALGYCVGRYQSNLLSKIEELRNVKPTTQKPTVILGPETARPKEVSNIPDDRSVGLVESKTPQLIEWEANQKIEKEARGY